MKYNLIIKDNNFDRDIILLLEKYPKIKKFYFKYVNKVNAKKILKKYSIKYNPKDVKILDIEDIPLFKYNIPLKIYKERYIDLLLQSRKILDFLEEHSNNFNKHYRKLDLFMIYADSPLITQMRKFLDLHLAIQVLLTKFEFKNIFIPLPKNRLLFLKLFELNNKDNGSNIYYIKKSKLKIVYSGFNLFIRFLFPLIELIFFKLIEHSLFKNVNSIGKSNSFNKKYIFNTKNPTIGFLYNSITHKRVGNDLFNYLKNKGINVVEINAVPQNTKEKSKKIFGLNRESKTILSQIKNFHDKTIKRFKKPFFILYSNYFLSILSLQIKTYLITIDYLYKRIEDENIDLLVAFNETSLPGKTAVLICKELKIPTLYIHHVSISEDYNFTSGKLCDVVILNSEIEKNFLLENKLDPKIYSKRLIPLGRSYFKPENLNKIAYIRDVIDKKYNQNLNKYKYKILLALVYDSNPDINVPYMNFKIINQLIDILKNHTKIKDYLLIIKLHPNDKPEYYKNFLKNKRDTPIVLTHQIDIRRLIISSNVFLTCISNTIIEGILLKTPTMILEYNYNVGHYLFNDENIIKTVYEKESLKKNLELLLLNKDYCNDYINKTYEFGLKFCKGFDEDNFTQNLNKKLFKIIQELIKK